MEAYATATKMSRRWFHWHTKGSAPRLPRDAADALDFLCQKHDLQHLDVKPANMLLVADRVKVADFGLVKDIQSNSMSMLGGMTPTYAAPEMFDGRPGRFSDQYSRAIVYQELLTERFLSEDARPLNWPMNICIELRTSILFPRLTVPS